MFIQFLAGGALGILLGLLVGLSSSPVVAGVVGTLTAALTVLLGFAKSDTSADPGQNTARATASASRLAGFGLLGAAALLTGLTVRTHNQLSQPIASQVHELTAAGFTPDEAHAWVAYRNAGLHLRIPEDSFDKTGKLASNASSVLFASHDADTCAVFDPSRYSSPAEQLNALSLAGPQFASFVQFGKQLDDKQRLALLQAAKPIFCP